jgi:DNA-binding transcriptional LysR family regulator
VYDAGFSRLDEVGEDISASPVWADQLVAVVPMRHPLLGCKRVPIQELVSYPLILAHPHASEGWYRHIERLLRTVDVQPVIAEYAGSTDLLLALIAAGYGVGFATEEQLAHVHNAEVVTRPLEGACGIVTTYLLRAEANPSPHATRFVERVSGNTIQ